MDIVLIPGALATHKFWHHQKNALKHIARIHDLDVCRGQSISEMALHLISNLPSQFILIGFSLGGYVALELMQHIPERINKIILINSAAKALSEKGKTERQRSIDLIERGKFNFLMNLIFKSSVYDKKQHSSLIPFLQSMAHEVGERHYTDQLTAMLSKPDHSNILEKIKCPALLLASREDKVMPPECSRHMAHYIKNSELIYIENCGHVAPLEQPNSLNQAILSWL